MDKINIGITGASGLIGSNLCKKLLKIPSYNYEIFDRKKYSLFNIESMASFVQDKAIIVHLAGLLNADSKQMMDVNAKGTLNLLKTIKKYNNKKPKFIFASSLHAYGSEERPLLKRETDNLKPTTIYGKSKRKAEEYVKIFSLEGVIKGIIFRFSNVYSEKEPTSKKTVIPLFIKKILNQEEIIIDGDGTQTRDFIHVTDAINAIIKGLEYKFKSQYEIFNICSGKPLTINKLLDLISQVANIKTKKQYTHKRKKDFLVADNQKALKSLDFSTSVLLKPKLETILGSLKNMNDKALIERIKNFKIICLMPAYNEGKNIGGVLKQIPDYIYKTIVVDDGSQDNTTEVAKSFKKVILLRNSPNKGMGVCYKKGYRKAIELGADIVVILHSDGQHDPKEILKLIHPIVGKKAHYALGSRFMKESSKIGKQPFIRAFGNKVIVLLWRLATKSKLNDVVTGYHAIDVNTLKKLNFERWSNDFKIETDTLIDLFLNDYKVIEVPVKCIYADETSYVNPLTVGTDYCTAAFVLIWKRFIKNLKP